MITIRKIGRKEALRLFTSEFGHWRTWSRSMHLAHCFAIGVPYEEAEYESNDSPHYAVFDAIKTLWKMDLIQGMEGTYKIRSLSLPTGWYVATPKELFSLAKNSYKWKYKSATKASIIR